MTVEEIASKLQIGDKKQIAEISGFSTQYVTMIFAGDRETDSKGAKEILQVAKDIIESREILKQKSRQRKDL